MTDHERKLMFFGQSVLNLLARTEIWDDSLDPIIDNALDLGLAEWIEHSSFKQEFRLIKPNK